MNTIRLTFSLIASGVVSASSAEIHWAVDVVVDDTAVSDLGTVIEAAFFTGPGGGNALGGSSQLFDPVTVNGTEFKATDFGFGEELTNLVDVTYNNGEFGHTTDTEGVGALVAGLGFESGVNPQFPQLVGLTAGETYVVQFFYFHRTVDRSLTINGDEVEGAILQDTGDPVVSTGTFVADGISQALVFDASAGSQFLNAYQLRNRPPVDDSDGDGMPNDYEVANPPLDPDVNDAGGDIDGDGSVNLEEFQRRTDVNDPDTDDDGLLDGTESGSGVFLGPEDPGTDPLVPDMDSDGLLDGAEVSLDNGYVTDPFLADTDGDHFLDPLEIQAGSDPTDAESTPDTGEPLCAYWPLDIVEGGPGTLTTPDLVNGMDLSLVNMDENNLVAGVAGNAFSFDTIAESMLVRVHGSSDPLPVSKYPSFSVSLWVNADGFGQDDLRFFSEGSTRNRSPIVNIGTGAGGASAGVDIFLRSETGEHNAHEVSFDQPLDGEGWHHLALVVNGVDGTVALYIDGDLDDGILAFVDTLTPVMDTTTLGGILRDSPSHWVTGSIDEVSLWKKDLSADEVAELAGGKSPIDPPGGQGLEITEVTPNPDGSITLTWTSIPGAKYTVEFAPDLATWIELEDGIDSGGASTQFTVPAAFIESQMSEVLFFRVLEAG